MPGSQANRGEEKDTSEPARGSGQPIQKRFVTGCGNGAREKDLGSIGRFKREFGGEIGVKAQE